MQTVFIIFGIWIFIGLMFVAVKYFMAASDEIRKDMFMLAFAGVVVGLLLTAASIGVYHLVIFLSSAFRAFFGG